MKGTGPGAGKLGSRVVLSVKGRFGLDVWGVRGLLVGGARQVTQSEVGQVGNVTPQTAYTLCQAVVAWRECGTHVAIWFCKGSWKPRLLKCEISSFSIVGN